MKGKAYRTWDFERPNVRGRMLPGPSKLSAKRHADKILMVRLYGTHARGDWIEDHLSGYRSDYDLLIVVNSKSSTTEGRC